MAAVAVSSCPRRAIYAGRTPMSELSCRANRPHTVAATQPIQVIQGHSDNSLKTEGRRRRDYTFAMRKPPPHHDRPEFICG